MTGPCQSVMRKRETAVNLNYRRWAFVTVAAAALVSHVAGPAAAETLQQAAAKAVQSNPRVEEAKRNREAQRYELRQARDLYMPSLDLSAGIGREWTDNTGINSRTLTRRELGATLTELLWDGMGRENRIEARASRLDAASYRVYERSEATALNAVEAYLDVLRNDDLVKLAEENILNHENYLGRVQDRVDGGQSGVGDLQQARSRLSAAHDALVQQKQQLADAEAYYISVVGEEPMDLVMPVISPDVMPLSQGDVVKHATAASPTVNAGAADLDEAVQNHEQAKSEYHPRVTLELSGTRNRDIDGVSGPNRDAQAMVRMTWNVFRGGVDMHRRMELAERIGESRAHVQTLEREIAQEARNSWNAREASNSRVDVLNDQLIANSQVVSIYEQEFDIGQRALLDLLDSQNELFLTRTQLRTAEYVALFASYRVLASMGELTRALDVALPEEAQAAAREDAGVTPEYTPGGMTPPADTVEPDAKPAS